MSHPEHPHLHLCIIENGLVPQELQASFDSYPSMIEQWLSPVLPEASFSRISVVRGEKLPEPGAFDGYLLTGSKHSVYEQTEWMQQLIGFLQQLKERSLPVFGICFGHQIMADAFGGRTRKAEQGWGVGAQHYHDNGNGPGAGATLIFHQDQVTDRPSEAEVVGGSDHCPNGVLRYAFAARSVQYHPEFSPDYIAALTKRYGDDLLGAQVADHSLCSLQQLCVDNQRIARWAANFFREYARTGRR